MNHSISSLTDAMGNLLSLVSGTFIMNPPTFMGLPTELRLIIYGYLLLGKSPTFGILSTSRQVYMESCEFLFKRPVIFRSLTDLTRWFVLVGTDHLHRVKEIRLTLPGVDNSHVLLRQMNSRRLPYLLDACVWQLYVQAVKTPAQALQKLPRVKTITLTVPSDRVIVHDFLAGFMAKFAAAVQGLQHLTLKSDFHQIGSVSFLSALQQLKSLTFDWNCELSMFETVDILFNLPFLSAIGVVSHRPLPMTHRCVFAIPDQDIPAYILGPIKPLESFSLKIHEPCRLTAHYFKLFLDSLVDSHMDSLERLSITFTDPAHPLEPMIVSALQDLITASRIRHIEYMWPSVDPDVLNTLLPDITLRSLRIRVENEDSASNVMYALLVVRDEGNLQNLEKVIFVNEGGDGDRMSIDNKTLKDRVAQRKEAIKELQKGGVVILWEEFDDSE